MEKESEDRKIISIDLDDDDDDGGGGSGSVDAVNSNCDEEDDCDDDIDVINHSNSGNSNLKTENNNTSTNVKKNKQQKITRAVKEILTNSNTKFMSNFDPELSNRERRKLSRKFNSEGRKNGSVCDENGVVIGVEKDICDCLVEDCPGCHFPCPKCRSCKCGVECRINRKWMYEAIENEAEVTAAKNASTHGS